MLQKLKKRLKEQKGFTLIELLAVIVILGIIAAIAVPAIGNIIQDSRVKAVRADALQVMSSAKLYNAQNPTDAAISSTDLSSYLENTSLTGYSVSVTAGKLALTADGVAGDVNVDINNATYEVLNNDTKWEATPSGTPLTLTIAP